MKSVVILGSTGSIGVQALEILAGDAEFRVAGLAACSSADEIAAQASACGAEAIALAEPAAAARAQEIWSGTVLVGDEGIRELIERAKPDIVLNGMVGAAGLGPTIFALSQGIDVALANKE